LFAYRNNAFNCSSYLPLISSDFVFSNFFFFFLMIRRPPRSTLFPTRALPIFDRSLLKSVADDGSGNAADDGIGRDVLGDQDRKSTRLNSSHPSISYAVFF